MFFFSADDEFEYEETQFKCPTCGQNLYRVVPSTMVVCDNNDTDPLFIV